MLGGYLVMLFVPVFFGLGLHSMASAFGCTTRESLDGASSLFDWSNDITFEQRRKSPLDWYWENETQLNLYRLWRPSKDMTAMSGFRF